MAPGSGVGRPATAGAGRGILVMIAALLMFSSIDAIAKLLVRDYSPLQVTWARYFFNLLPFLLLLGRVHWRRQLRTGRPWLQLGRGATLLASALTVIAAFRHMALADAIVLCFVWPLMVTALSIPLLRETVGWRRWLGVACGFVGVMIVMRPGGDGMGWIVALPLLSALTWALGMIATRVMAASELPFATLFYTVLTGVVGMSVFLPAVWVSPDLGGWLLMASMGVLGGLGHLLIVRAHGMAPASLLAPFAYTQIVWAGLYGFLLFAELPDGMTLLGSAIIVGSGLYVFLRETRAPPPGP